MSTQVFFKLLFVLLYSRAYILIIIEYLYIIKLWYKHILYLDFTFIFFLQFILLTSDDNFSIFWYSDKFRCLWIRTWQSTTRIIYTRYMDKFVHNLCYTTHHAFILNYIRYYSNLTKFTIHDTSFFIHDTFISKTDTFLLCTIHYIPHKIHQIRNSIHHLLYTICKIRSWYINKNVRYIIHYTRYTIYRTLRINFKIQYTTNCLHASSFIRYNFLLTLQEILFTKCVLK